MAKLKKSVRAKTSAGTPSPADLQAKAEQVSRSLVESAQQIWMAGVGAFTRAQGEGSKLFEALVKEGMTLEQSTRKLATGKVDAVRGAMEDRVGVVRERATESWDRLEKVFEERVQRALNRLGVPDRAALEALTARVAALTPKSAATSAKSERSKSSARKAPNKAAQKPVAKRVSKTTATAGNGAKNRRTLPKAPKPVTPQSH